MSKFTPKLFLVLLSTALFIFTLRGEAGKAPVSEFKGNLDQETRPFELSPERGRYAHVVNLAENDRYDLGQEWADAVYPDVGYREGRFYSFFAPGISYLATPFYQLGGMFGMAQLFTFGFISICAVLSLLFIYKISDEVFRLPPSLSLLAPVIYAFATTSWSYAITLYQHHVFTLLLLSGFYAVWRYRQGARLGWLWGVMVWANYGLAILIDYPNAILMLPVMVYFLVSSFSFKDGLDKYTVSFRWAILATFVVFIGISAFHGHHNKQHFGSWKNLSGGIIGYKDIKESNLDGSDEDAPSIAELQATKKVSNFFAEERFVRGLQILMASKDRGLFLYSPIMLLGIFGILMSWRKMILEYSILLSLLAVNLLLYSSWGDPWGGWAYGPRYLIPSMALLSVFAVVFIRDFKYQVTGRLLAFILIAYSSAIALLGALTTNAIPPKIEADYLNTGYNFTHNWGLLQSNLSGSYVYNTYFSGDLSLMQYGILIIGPLLVVAVAALFFIPVFEHDPKN